MSWSLTIALLLLGLAWELWLAPLRPGGSTWAWKVLPLIVALPGIWRMRLYTYRWLSLLVWLYVMEGSVRGWGDTATLSRWLAVAQAVLAMALFAACTWHIRLRVPKKPRTT